MRISDWSSDVCSSDLSARAASVGQVLLKNLTTAGFQGSITAVNPHTMELGGIKAVPDIASLAETTDLAVIATPPQTVPGIVDELAQRGTRAAVILTAGVCELGAEGTAPPQLILDAARQHQSRKGWGRERVGEIE